MAPRFADTHALRLLCALENIMGFVNGSEDADHCSSCGTDADEASGTIDHADDCIIDAANRLIADVKATAQPGGTGGRFGADPADIDQGQA